MDYSCRIAFVVLFAFSLTGCNRTAENKSPLAMMVLPAGGSPGMIVRVTATKPIFLTGAAAIVEIGGQRATISRIISETEADVLVPNAHEGQTTVTIADTKKGKKEFADFTVLPASARELVLRIKDNRVELVGVHATSGEPSGSNEPSGELQLSFDVLNAAGAVVYTGAMPNPATQRMEVFDGPDAASAKIRREKVTHETVFAIKVPNVPGEATVKFFEGPAGVNLLQAEGRDRRKYLNEIKVKAERE